MSIKVVVVGTGFVGAQGLGAVIDHPDLELVGLVVSNPDKVGKDAGVIAGTGPTGIIATDDLTEALAAGPECVAYFSTTHGRLKATIEEFVTILRSGANIVTTSVGALINPSFARPDVLDRLNAACAEGNTSLFSTGVDPGFFSDYLPVVLSGASRRIDAIDIYEMAIYESGGQSDMVAFDQCGFGEPIDFVPPLVDPNGLRAAWGGVLTMIGEQLGVTVDEIDTHHEMLPSPETFPYQGRVIEKGTVAGMRFSVLGKVNGKALINLHHVTRAREDFAPDWPRPHGHDGYRVVVSGDPRMECETEFISDDGDTLKGGFCITAMRAINAIEPIIKATPGVKSVFDLPLITGKGRLG